MNNTIFKELVNEAIVETELLLGGKFKEDAFLREVHEILVVCRSGGYKVATKNFLITHETQPSSTTAWA